MLLSDRTIRSLLDSGRLAINPQPTEERLQPASVDLTLGSGVQFPYGPSGVIPSRGFKIHPGMAVLFHTEEAVKLPADVAGRVEGKSTWGRQFLQVHSTAGFIDPGFHGQIVLEVVNLGPRPIQVHAGITIAQICFLQMDRDVARPYGSPGLGSKYQDQKGAVGAR